jgi:hypothetical protein
MTPFKKQRLQYGFIIFDLLLNPTALVQVSGSSKLPASRLML